MKIFIIIALVTIAMISGIFFRMSWENYKSEDVALSRYWFNTIPATVTQPFCFATFIFLMSIFILTTVL